MIVKQIFPFERHNFIAIKLKFNGNSLSLIVFAFKSNGQSGH